MTTASQLNLNDLASALATPIRKRSEAGVPFAMLTRFVIDRTNNVQFDPNNLPGSLLNLLASLGAGNAVNSALLSTQTAYASDGAISILNGTALLTKAGVGAYTLAAPTAAQAGTRLVITNRTANAHVVTATGLLEDGVTGGAKNTATFGAFVGATISLEAIGLKWTVVSKNVVTVA